MNKEYIEKRVRVVGECWEWTGYIKPNGYGEVQFRKIVLGQRRWYAHRLSYVLFKGNIDPTKEIDHLCRNRKCVNPEHLESVTHKENLFRGNTLVRSRMMQTHCKRGHIFDESNTYHQISGNGVRACKRCRSAFEIRRYWKNRGISMSINDALAKGRHVQVSATEIKEV